MKRFDKIKLLYKFSTFNEEGVSLPKTFSIEFRAWIRDFYYQNKIDSRSDMKNKSIRANYLFKNESEHTKKKIYAAWLLIKDAKDDQFVTDEEFSKMPKRTMEGIKSLLYEDENQSIKKTNDDSGEQLSIPFGEDYE